MWIFTKYGFFSAVCAKPGKGQPGQPVDPDRLMVRARVRNHLESLKNRFPESLGVCPIEAHVGTDYAYRIFVPKGTWAKVIAALTDEIDYGNFKSEVRRHGGKEGEAYEHALHDVWGVMFKLQK
jgi:hypothetical protein